MNMICFHYFWCKQKPDTFRWNGQWIRSVHCFLAPPVHKSSKAFIFYEDGQMVSKRGMLLCSVNGIASKESKSGFKENNRLKDWRTLVTKVCWRFRFLGPEVGFFNDATTFMALWSFIFGSCISQCFGDLGLLRWGLSLVVKGHAGDIFQLDGSRPAIPKRVGKQEIFHHKNNKWHLK